MEEKKLLCILNQIIFIIFVACSFAVGAEEVSYEKHIIQEAEKVKSIVLQGILEKYTEYQKLEGNLDNGIREEDIKLRVFVSSILPINLLKAYAKEANRYNAVLVFKGLPNGSFKELMKLVSEIQADGINAPMQIDDNAFTEFGVKTVPTFVLSKEPGVLKHNNSKINFDKVVGNIGIRTALEKFKDEGELREEAKKCLNLFY